VTVFLTFPRRLFSRPSSILLLTAGPLKNSDLLIYYPRLALTQLVFFTLNLYPLTLFLHISAFNICVVPNLRYHFQFFPPFFSSSTILSPLLLASFLSSQTFLCRFWHFFFPTAPCHQPNLVIFLHFYFLIFVVFLRFFFSFLVPCEDLPTMTIPRSASSAFFFPQIPIPFKASNSGGT